MSLYISKISSCSSRMMVFSSTCLLLNNYLVHPDNTKGTKSTHPHCKYSEKTQIQIPGSKTNAEIEAEWLHTEIPNATMKQHVWIDIQLAGWAIDLNIDRLKGVVLHYCCAFGQTLIMVILRSKSLSCSQKSILERAPLLICELYLYIYILNLFPDVWLKAKILDSYNKLKGMTENLRESLM